MTTIYILFNFGEAYKKIEYELEYMMRGVYKNKYYALRDFAKEILETDEDAEYEIFYDDNDCLKMDITEAYLSKYGWKLVKTEIFQN